MADESETGGPSTKVSKAAMTDEERLALCQKLDRELDEFIDGLEKKRYTDGWSEDNWEEEMDKHPFFMKSTPENEMSPLAEGLAKLKYDPEENTPLELANNYKEDGNFNFKHKNYRLAILGYTEGIRVKCDDAELNANLYNNRAAAHWHLKNYRSALADCEKALTFNPKYDKARLRAAKCAQEIGKHDTSIQHCEKLLQTDPSNKEVVELLKVAKKKKMVHERNTRKTKLLQQKRDDEKDAIIKAISKRKIKIAKCEDGDDLDIGKLEPTFATAEGAMVSYKDGMLYWPILLLYPEFQMTDFIKECPENVSLRCQLDQVFPAPWDTDNKYSMNTISIYYEGWDLKPHKVDPDLSLAEILTSKYFEVKRGTPVFSVVVKGSATEKTHLGSYIGGYSV